MNIDSSTLYIEKMHIAKFRIEKNRLISLSCYDEKVGSISVNTIILSPSYQSVVIGLALDVLSFEYRCTSS